LVRTVTSDRLVFLIARLAKIKCNHTLLDNLSKGDCITWRVKRGDNSITWKPWTRLATCLHYVNYINHVVPYLMVTYHLTNVFSKLSTEYIVNWLKWRKVRNHSSTPRVVMAIHSKVKNGREQRAYLWSLRLRYIRRMACVISR